MYLWLCMFELRRVQRRSPRRSWLFGQTLYIFTLHQYWPSLAVKCHALSRAVVCLPSASHALISPSSQFNRFVQTDRMLCAAKPTVRSMPTRGCIDCGIGFVKQLRLCRGISATLGSMSKQMQPSPLGQYTPCVHGRLRPLAFCEPKGTFRP